MAVQHLRLARKNDPELQNYYPTSTLVTDRGIIYLWVARMVMMGLFNMDERPFDDVYIHGTVLDETGTKMSKSLKNGIDPLVMIDGGEMEYHPGGVIKRQMPKNLRMPGLRRRCGSLYLA